jgi:hypothetical protein
MLGFPSLISSPLSLVCEKASQGSGGISSSLSPGKQGVSQVHHFSHRALRRGKALKQEMVPAHLAQRFPTLFLPIFSYSLLRSPFGLTCSFHRVCFRERKLELFLLQWTPDTNSQSIVERMVASPAFLS